MSAPPVVEYRLGEEAALRRARGTALVQLAAGLAPIALVVVLLHKLGFVIGGVAAAVIAAMVLLAAAQGIAGYRRVGRALRSFTARLTPAGLEVRTHAIEATAQREAIQRVVEIDGRFGGLRVELEPSKIGEEDPERLDIPRGGERFGDLRAALEAWCGVQRAPRRGRAVRVGVGVLVVAAIFFLPFVMGGLVERSKPLALGLVLGLWVALRFVVRRG